MSKEKNKKASPKAGKKNTCRANIPDPLPDRYYRVGVYLPDRDPLEFFIKAHVHIFDENENSCNFYYHTEMVAAFRYVVYILLIDENDVEKAKGAVKLPKDFGKVV